MDMNVFRYLTYGMYVVGARENERNVGCIINTSVQITSEPATIAISLNKNNYTFSAIEKSGEFSISILSEQTDPQVIGKFGFSSSADTDKFSSFKHKVEYGLPVLLEDTCGALICKVVSVTDMGTHCVIMASVENTIAGENTAPMTYSYYHTVIKGKAPKAAPTYIAEGGESNMSETKETVQYRCTICGYILEGELTDDYICPVCGAGADAFEKVQ
ncbi:MAG: flavin reductase [Oscillospiraceae bacterium]|jgi:flavin reductase (DIM6/NTAB) family NADH-FMN oxidoreductase RutF/rubredoxin|nr:flavin reductase [Oscillospiraceae bacterium]